MAVVELRGLAKRYGAFEAVSGLDVEVEAGEVFGLLGPNGAGKTTTIRMLMGILQPSAGEARIGGRDCFAERAEVMRDVGYLPDEPVFYDYLTGREIIGFVGGMRGYSRDETDARAAPLAERLQLSDDLDEYAVNYSHGMKKKLAAICAMLHDPALLILDEPTNGLDPIVTRVFHDIVRERAAAGRSLFLATHLLDQAERLCARVGILHHGRLAACGPLEDLRARIVPGGTLEEIFFRIASEESGGR